MNYEKEKHKEMLLGQDHDNRLLQYYPSNCLY